MSISGIEQNSVLSELAFANRSEEETSEAKSDKDMFMKLLMAQIENQDPLKPADQTEFVAQLAQFSSLEGIQNLSNTVQDIGAMYRSSQALQATALVGREVLVTGQVGYLEDAGKISGTIEAGQTSGDVMMTVKDASGQVVSNVDLGNIGSAETPFEWDGTDNEGNTLPAGVYSISIEGTMSGESAALITSMYSRVNSVSIVDNQGGMKLNLNGIGQVDSNDIQEVR